MSDPFLLAACCNEAFKVCTNTSGNLNNYMMYNGVNGVYTYTFEYEQKPGCAVCGSNVSLLALLIFIFFCFIFLFDPRQIFAYEISREAKLQTLVDNLADDPK